MKLSQLLTSPNQLTLLRMSFLPFIVIKLVDGRYGVALTLFVLAGMSDGLDGLLARTLKQQTVLGQYLDPIADKMLLSTVFLVLSILHKIPWKYHGGGFQPGHFHSGCEHGVVRHCRVARFPAQRFRQGQYLRPGRRGVLCAVAANKAGTLDLTSRVSRSCTPPSSSPSFRRFTTFFW